MDGKIHLQDKARQHQPMLGLPPDSNAQTGWLEEITILHLASQTAGFDKNGGYTPLLFKPGTEWAWTEHLVFSGNDSFSVRRGTLLVVDGENAP